MASFNIQPNFLSYIRRQLLPFAVRIKNHVVLFLFSILAFQSITFSQIAPVNPPAGGFHIDGGLRANTPTPNIGDWYPGSGGTGGSVFNNSSVPISPATAQTSALATPDAYNGNDNIFTNGSKFNDYIGDLNWFINSAPDKNDINNALYHVSRDASNNQWVFIAGDRLSTNGTSYIDFEFLQGTVSPVTATGKFDAHPLTSKPNGGGRTQGDIIISMEYTNGGTKPNVSIYQWKLSGSTWSYQLANIANLSTNAFAETNRTGAETNVPYSAFGTNTYPQFAFVEAAINITYVINQLNQGNTCAGLGIQTLWIKTKASASSTAALKDFINPIPVNFQFGNSGITPISDKCSNDNTQYLLAGTPSGGTFTGSGVSQSGGNYYFTPSVAGAGTHTISYSVSGCNATTTITVNATPGAPTVGVVDNCNGTSTLTVTGLVAGATITWTDDAANHNNPRIVTAAGTYSVTQTANGCTSIAGSGTAAPKATPPAPSVSYNPPACDEATFSVTINSPTSGAIYSIVDKNGNTISGVTPGSSYTAPNTTSFNFSNIPAGSGYKVTVTNNSCPSSPNTCGTVAPLTTTTAQSKEALSSIVESQTKVLAFPNPFSDKIRFTIQPDVSGKGSLELYNILGQKVKTVFHGNVEKGQVQTIEYSVPGAQRANLIYLFRIGNQRVTGKLIGLK
jgi:hypothetical protein